MAAKPSAARRLREKKDFAARVPGGGPERAPAAAPGPKGTPAPQLDRLVHERLRLGILSALSVNDALTFNDLKKLLETTDGNLSVHARKLEEAGYITCAKSFHGRMPRSDYRLTATGRRALDRYLDHMEALIQAMRK
ncbi:MAG: winged helix-turn-helix domain-containing protein [Bryobacteraceae bacterium]